MRNLTVFGEDWQDVYLVEAETEEEFEDFQESDDVLCRYNGEFYVKTNINAYKANLGLLPYSEVDSLQVDLLTLDEVENIELECESELEGEREEA